MVRGAVARNPNTPAATLKALAKDPERWVRFVVAGNLETPAEVLAMLDEDGEEGVRLESQFNPSRN